VHPVDAPTILRGTVTAHEFAANVPVAVDREQRVEWLRKHGFHYGTRLLTIEVEEVVRDATATAATGKRILLVEQDGDYDPSYAGAPGSQVLLFLAAAEDKHRYDHRPAFEPINTMLAGIVYPHPVADDGRCQSVAAVGMHAQPIERFAWALGDPVPSGFHAEDMQVGRMVLSDSQSYSGDSPPPISQGCRFLSWDSLLATVRALPSKTAGPDE